MQHWAATQEGMVEPSAEATAAAAAAAAAEVTADGSTPGDGAAVAAAEAVAEVAAEGPRAILKALGSLLEGVFGDSISFQMKQAEEVEEAQQGAVKEVDMADATPDSMPSLEPWGGGRVAEEKGESKAPSGDGVEERKAGESKGEVMMQRVPAKPLFQPGEEDEEGFSTRGVPCRYPLISARVEC
jgi:hypothetical protein